jgi:hypothetical protein
MIHMQSSGALILALVAAVLVVAAVVLYSLVARKMYAKDKEMVASHRSVGSQTRSAERRSQTPGEPETAGDAEKTK